MNNIIIIIILLLLFNNSIEKFTDNNPYNYKSRTDVIQDVINILKGIIFNPTSLITPASRYAIGNNKGPKCNPDRDLKGLLCYERCKPNYTLSGLTCYSKCDPDKIDVGLLCRDKCKSGYKDVAGVCWSSCPDGYRDDGATCFKDLKCSTKWDGCASKVWGRCVGGVKTSCEGPDMKSKDSYVPTSKAKNSYLIDAGKGPTTCQNVDTYYDVAMCVEYTPIKKVMNRLKYIN
jgi:hypothetical protein